MPAERRLPDRAYRKGDARCGRSGWCWPRVAMIIIVGVVVGRRHRRLREPGPAPGLYATGLWSRNGPSTLPSASTERRRRPPSRPLPTAQRRQRRRPICRRRSWRPPTAGRPPDAAKVAARIADGPGQGRPRAATPARWSTSAAAKTLFRHQADRRPDPGLHDEAAHRGRRAVHARPGAHLHHLGGQPESAARSSWSAAATPTWPRSPAAGAFPQRASITDLARSTAAALAQAQDSSVRLGLRRSLFAGPAWNPAWPSVYGDQVTPVSALWVDEGRVSGGSPGPRASDPAREAADGVRRGAAQAGRTGHRAGRAKAPRRRPRSPASRRCRCERIVEQMLMVSDNDAAEVLFRHVAVAAAAAGLDRPRRPRPSGPS